MSNVLEKGTKILNPKTKRFVTVGSSSWRKLVLDGTLQGAYKEANSSKPLKSELKSELVFDEELENNPPEVQFLKEVLVKKPRVRAKKMPVPEPESIVEYQSDPDENLDELEQHLSQILHQQSLSAGLLKESTKLHELHELHDLHKDSPKFNEVKPLGSNPEGP